MRFDLVLDPSCPTDRGTEQGVEAMARRAHARSAHPALPRDALPVLRHVVPPPWGPVVAAAVPSTKLRGVLRPVPPLWPPAAATRAGLRAAAAGALRPDDAGCFRATYSADSTLVVPRGAAVQGDVEAGNVLVCGTVHGNVHAHGGDVVIDRGGRVEGRVSGTAAIVIAGDVRAGADRPAVVSQGLLCLAETACVQGRVHYTVIEIYRGARVAGSLLALQAVT